MARIKGITKFAANFEPEAAGPLDARFIVDVIADLYLTATWTALDGGVYVYKGMFVSVSSDPTPENNGMYILLDPANYTLPVSWMQLGVGGGDENFSYKKIDTGEEITIPTNQQMLVDGAVTVDGDLIVDGEVVELVADGGDPPNVITEILYADLRVLYDTSTMSPGMWYQITDFATKHVIPRTVVINEEPIEIMVFAVSSSELAQDGYTLEGDKIKYDITLDEACDDGGVFIDSRNGWITEYTNKEQGITLGYDYKRVLFRRWKLDTTAMAYNAGTSYLLGDLVIYNNVLYASCKHNHSGHTPGTVDEFYWNLVILNVSNMEYLGRESVTHSVATGVFRVVAGDYIDVHTFEYIETSNSANHNIHENVTGITDLGFSPGELPNNVYFIPIVGAYSATINYFSGALDLTFYCDTISDLQFLGIASQLIFTANIQANVFEGYVWRNVFSHLLTNIFGSNFMKNTLYSVRWNRIGSSCYDNQLQSFEKNQVGTSFSNNRLASYIYNNVFGNKFQGNTTYGEITFSSFGNEVTNNDFRSRIESCKIKDHVNNNDFVRNIKKSTIGESNSYNVFNGEVELMIFGGDSHYNTFKFGGSLVGATFCDAIHGINFSGNNIYVQGTKSINKDNLNDLYVIHLVAGVQIISDALV